MDLLRGIAIVLVLAWHAPAIPVLYGYEMPTWLLAANNTLLPFRMPTLMFLSGLLLPRSLGKPLGTYLYGKVRMLVWPYVLWAGLHMVIYGAVAPMYHPRAWIATGYLWFLFFIACYYFLAPFVRWVPAWLLPLAMFVLSVPAPDSLSTRFLYFGGFFFAGNLVAQRPQWLEAALARRWVVAGCTAAAVALGAWSAMADTQYQAQYAVGSLAGILAAIAGARAVEGAAWTVPVQAIGRRSLVYYAAHFPIMIGTLTLLELMGVESLLVIAAANFVVALALCAVLARYREVPPVRWLFEAPRFRRRQPTAAVVA